MGGGETRSIEVKVTLSVEIVSPSIGIWQKDDNKIRKVTFES